MLVITRKVDQSVRIGDEIEIVIVGVEGNKVKLGILAPSNSAIVRTENPSERTSGAPERLPQETARVDPSTRAHPSD